MASTSDIRTVPISIRNIIPELTSQSSTTGRKRLLCSILATSQRLDRAFSQGLIFVVGSSGSGKSSTINHLFNLSTQTGREIALSNESQSGTLNVKEYLLSTSSEQYSTSDISLGIVDTPGFQDTTGLKQEACRMHAIQKFLKEHPALKGKYPNLVFLRFDASDVRFEGPCSNFNKSIKSIKKLGFVDTGHPNVIAVITKCCTSRPRSMEKERQWKNKIYELKDKVKEIIGNHLHIEVPVVLLENKFDDEELDRPMLPNGETSDFTQLPTGELQPYNLFDTCASLLNKHNDLFGLICLETIFLKGHSTTLSRGFQILSKVVDIDDNLNAEESALLSFLENINKEIESCFIKEKAKEFIRDEKLIEDHTANIRDLVCELNKNGCFEEEDLKLLDYHCIEYLLGRELKDMEAQFITNSLNITEMSVQMHIKNALELGFNIFTDRFSNHQIFNSPGSPCYGVMLPENFSSERVSETERFLEIAQTRKELLEKRIEFLEGVEVDVKETDFETDNRHGFLIIDENPDQSSFDVEYLEALRLKVNADMSKAQLSSEFISAVDALPPVYSSQSKDEFEMFFGKFGHYLISSAFIGGSYEKLSSGQTLYRGGSSEFNQGLLNSQIKKKWIASIMTNPIVLTTKMSMEPIATPVTMVNTEKGTAVLQAMSEISLHQKGNHPDINSQDSNPPMSPSQPVVSSRSLVSSGQPLTRAEAVEESNYKIIGFSVFLLALVGCGYLFGPVNIGIIILAVVKARLG